jgi:hypothetical protein
MAPAFGAPKKSKIVGRFAKTAGDTISRIPSSMASNRAQQKVQVDHQQAAPSAMPMGMGAARTVNDTQETIQTPQAQQDMEPTTGVEGIDRIGKAATAEARIKANNRNTQANSAASSMGASSGDFTGMGDGSGLDSEQLEFARQIANVGKQRGHSDEDIQIAIMTALAESGLRNLNYGDRDSVGLFQQRTSQGWGSIDQIMNVDYSAGKFYDGLKGAGGGTAWQRAQAVQRSAFADGSNYQAQWGKAQAAFKSIYSPQQGVSTSPVPGKNGSASWINANYNQYHDFDGRYGAQCVDLYNFYMTGFVGGRSSVGQVNYAQELWGRHDTGALVQIARNQKPQMGDIAIWSNSFNGQGGHVAIVSQDNGNGTIRVLNANATSQGSAGRTTMSNLSTGTLLGYLRPRKLM